MKRSLLFAVLVLAAAGAVQAHEYTLGKITIGHPWARPTAEGISSGAAYFSLKNSGDDADRLVSAESPIAAKTQIHETIDHNGVMKMRPAEGGVAVEPGATVEFKPGAYHVMLFDLKHKLALGEHIPLTLTFAKAGSIEVSVYVEKTQGGHDEAGTMHHHDMSGMDHSMH
jgi:hypothetical protein